MKLYEISNEYQTALNMVDEDGCITEEGLALLDKVDSEIEVKAKNIGLAFQQQDYDIEVLDKEIERLTNMKKSIKKNQDSFKKYLAYNLQKAGIEKLDTGTHKIGFRKSIQTVVENVDLLPDEFRKEKTTITADKTAIKKALQSGETIEGARLEEINNLQIK